MSIYHELTKELKLAGYPQGTVEVGPSMDDNFTGVVSIETHSYFPDTDELVDELGVELRNIIRHTEFRKTLKEPFEAVPNKKLRPEAKSKKGENIWIALARLYIELNKK